MASDRPTGESAERRDLAFDVAATVLLGLAVALMLALVLIIALALGATAL